MLSFVVKSCLDRIVLWPDYAVVHALLVYLDQAAATLIQEQSTLQLEVLPMLLPFEHCS